jgi:hypothetical protein
MGTGRVLHVEPAIDRPGLCRPGHQLPDDQQRRQPRHAGRRGDVLLQDRSAQCGTRQLHVDGQWQPHQRLQRQRQPLGFGYRGLSTHADLHGRPGCERLSALPIRLQDGVQRRFLQHHARHHKLAVRGGRHRVGGGRPVACCRQRPWYLLQCRGSAGARQQPGPDAGVDPGHTRLRLRRRGQHLAAGARRQQPVPGQVRVSVLARRPAVLHRRSSHRCDRRTGLERCGEAAGRRERRYRPEHLLFQAQ